MAIAGLNGEREEVEMLDKDIICDSVDIPEPGKWREVLADQDLPLAYDTISEDHPWTGTIDVLIGADLYYKFVTGPNVRLNDELMAVETMFGWVLHGPLGGVAGPDTLVLHTTTTTMQGESPKTAT